MSNKFLQTLLRKAKQAAILEDASAAMEATLILPIALMVIIGSLLAIQGWECNSKVQAATAEITDIVSQQVGVTGNQLATFMGMAGAILTPFPTGISMVISEIDIDSSGAATVGWSQASSGAALTAGSTVTLPQGMNTPSTSLIYGTAAYVWTPALSIPYLPTNVFQSVTLHANIYRVPRNLGPIAYSP